MLYLEECSIVEQTLFLHFEEMGEPPLPFLMITVSQKMRDDNLQTDINKSINYNLIYQITMLFLTLFNYTSQILRNQFYISIIKQRKIVQKMQNLTASSSFYFARILWKIWKPKNITKANNMNDWIKTKFFMRKLISRKTKQAT